MTQVTEPDEKVVDANNSPKVIVSTTNLTIRFGQRIGVEDVSFEIPQGQIFGFIGPSGSGKTTTVRLLTGFYRATAGQALVLGQSPAQFSTETRAKIGYMPQLFALYPELSVEENLNFAASIYGMREKRRERFDELLELVELTEDRKKLARNLSGGMKRRLSLAATLVHSPELLFLDEPTAGIDPVLRRRFWDYFQALKAAGCTLFITTQYVGEAAYCDKVGVMAEGRLLMVETPAGLRRRAFEGEVVDLHTQERLRYEDLRYLRRRPFVVNKNVTRLADEKGIRLVVNEASTAIPALLEWCKEEYVTVKSIEQYDPPFDDVFVELVQKETKRVAHDV